MFVHIGENVGVKSNEIIGIFDLENATVRESSRGFLVDAEKKSRVTYTSDKMPRSFVVTSSKDGVRVFLTQLSAKAIYERANKSEQEY